MRKGGGKAKGAQMERDVCKALSLWISKHTQEDVFWRSAMSGGRSTVAAKGGKRLVAQAGDISCIHPAGYRFADKFYIEIKTYKDLQFHGLATGKGRLVEFWAETFRQADHYGKWPMLIAKQNQQPTVVCMGVDGTALLGLEPCVVLSAPRLDLKMLPFKVFLEKAVFPCG